MKRYFVKSDQLGYFKAFCFSPLDVYVSSMFDAHSFIKYADALECCGSLIKTISDLSIIEADVEIKIKEPCVSLKEKLTEQYLKNKAIVEGGVTDSVTESQVLYAQLNIKKFLSICKQHHWDID